jgi:hypothetical protein
MAELRYIERGELGAEDGAKSDMVRTDCIDQRLFGVVGGGIETEVCERIVVAVDKGVNLIGMPLGLLVPLGGVNKAGFITLRFFFGLRISSFLAGA